MGFKFLSHNVMGLNHLAKHRSIWNQDCKQTADVLNIQETHFCIDATPKCTHSSYPHVFMASASEKKKGVLVAIKHTVSFVLEKCIFDP